MKFIIHKGTNEIGGTCVEVESSDTKILLDAGLPLKEDSTPTNVKSLNVNAVLISHAHQDHAGLLDKINPETPVYIGKLTYDLLSATRLFIDKSKLNNNFVFIEPWKTFEIGSFKITPYLVDHSSSEAFAYLIEADGKKLFYSGDFRGHGRKNKLFNKMIENPIKDIDVLLMEGTMMERSNERFSSEQVVQDFMTDKMKDDEKLWFLISSSQNIDRMVSAYNACLKTGRELIVDIYTAWVFEQVAKVSKAMPIAGRNGLRIYTPNKQYQVIKKPEFKDFNNRVFSNQVKSDEFFEKPEKFLMAIRLSGAGMIAKSIARIGKVGAFYSQWEGYLKEKDKYVQIWDKIVAEGNLENHYAHTSGHAPLDDLKSFAKAINPKLLVPIHTEKPELYKQHFNNVELLNDEQVFIV